MFLNVTSKHFPGFQDSFVNLIKEKMKEKSFVAGKFVTVCYIPPNFKLDEVDTDFSVDGTLTYHLHAVIFIWLFLL